MRKLMLEVVAFTLTTEQIGQVRDVFEALDSDKSGTLELEEVTSALTQFEGLGDDEVTHIFDSVRVHQGHSLNYNEFVAATMWRRIHMDEERIHQASYVRFALSLLRGACWLSRAEFFLFSLRQVFDTLDVDSDGFLTRETIENVVGKDFSPEAVAAMVSRFECCFGPCSCHCRH